MQAMTDGSKLLQTGDKTQQSGPTNLEEEYAVTYEAHRGMHEVSQ